MKKLISLLLAMVMVFSLATVAFAEGEGTTTSNPTIDTPTGEDTDPSQWTSKVTSVDLALNKLYVIIGEKNSSGVDLGVKGENNTIPATTLVPKQTLTFKSTPDTGNPDAPEAEDIAASGLTEEQIKNMANLTIAPITDGAGMTYDAKDNAMKGSMSITLPTYSKVGVYKYVVTEVNTEDDADAVQGASYNIKNAAIGINVLVTYDYANKCLKPTISLTTLGTDADKPDDRDYADVDESETATKWKLDTFENQYDVGHLTVKKTVSGNLASTEQYFDFTVVFTATKPVATDITFIGASDTTLTANDTITIAEWDDTANDSNPLTYTKNFKLKANETVKFYNIPAGVAYTVQESDSHNATDNNGTNSATGYTTTGEVGESANKTITSKVQDDVVVNNHKNTEVNTGIALDSAPYFLMLAVALFGMVALVSKKRYEV